MKRIVVLVIVLVGLGVYWFLYGGRSSGPKAPKPVPMALKKHSAAFNNSVNNVVDHYLALKDAFIEADTSAVKQQAVSFIASLNHMDTVELKKDTAMIFETVMASINDVRSNAESLLQQVNITEMRKDFSSVTDIMYPTFFTAIAYEGPTLYFDNCPMAFSDSIPANWITNSAEIVNPYLGKKHPVYHATMLGCGEIKDSIEAKGSGLPKK